MPGQPRRTTRLARALGLDGNPLRRPSDRAEAWIRIGLLAAFLTAAPIAAPAAGGWAYHAGITATHVRAGPVHRHSATAVRPALVPSYLDQAGQGSQAWAGTRWQSTGTSARSGEVLAAVMTLVLIALALLAVLRLTLSILRRRRLAAWEMAWSRIGPQWTGNR